MEKETDLRKLTAINCTRLNDFFVTDDGSGAYCFDLDESIIFVDFASGKETKLTIKTQKAIRGYYPCSLLLRFENYANNFKDETQFIRTVIKDKSNKIFCMLFSANIRKETVSVIDVKETAFTFTSNSYPYLYRTKSEKYFLVQYNPNELSLIVSEISVNESRILKIEAIARHEQLIHPGLLCPFVEDDAVFYFSDENSEKKLIKLPFDGSQALNIALPYESFGSLHPIFPGIPTYFNESVVYLCTDGSREMIEIFALNMKQVSWSRVSAGVSRARVTNFGRIDTLPDGSAFILIWFEKFTEIYQLDLSISNKYALSQRKLGEGGFGVVVEGIINGSLHVAVKIPHDFSATPIDRKRQTLLLAISEARQLKMLDHPNIIKGYGFVIEENRFMLFMELMVESVRQKLLRTAGKRLEEKEAFRILQQALEGLVYLHTLKPKPIVHRDVKYRNGSAKLGDLGIINTLLLNTAGTTDLSLAPNATAGTNFWKAPEVLQQGSKYGRKADVWSIGCSLVEMLIGYPPHVTMTVESWAIELNSGELAYNPSQLVPGASHDVVDILEKCFRRETKKETLVQAEGNQFIRPHSWELLADVITINALKDIQERVAQLRGLNEAHP